MSSARLCGRRLRCRFGRARRCVMRSGGAMRFPQMPLRLRFGMMQYMLRRVQGRHANRARGKNKQSQSNGANAGQIHPATSSQLLDYVPRVPSSGDALAANAVPCFLKSRRRGHLRFRRFLAGRPLHRESGRPSGEFYNKFNPEKQNPATNSDVPDITLDAFLPTIPCFLPFWNPSFLPRQAVSALKTSTGAEMWEHRDRARALRRIQEIAPAQAARRAPPAPVGRLEPH